MTAMHRCFLGLQFRLRLLLSAHLVNLLNLLRRLIRNTEAFRALALLLLQLGLFLRNCADTRMGVSQLYVSTRIKLY
eukprot:SAG11_NODE_4104_length_2063_cov_1.708248_2_plen_77_part_00